MSVDETATLQPKDGPRKDVVVEQLKFMNSYKRNRYYLRHEPCWRWMILSINKKACYLAAPVQLDVTASQVCALMCNGVVLLSLKSYKQ